MALYAIGDIQGCHSEFRDLLDLIGFDASRDRLWLVGDLVNRGPGSLAVLRDVMAMGDAATTVLGNHDFHLLTIAAGYRKPHRGDTLDHILAAPDRDSLVSWLIRRPLVAVDENYVLVHAGLLPPWTAAQALALSREVEAMLASDRAREFLGVLYGDEPRQWRDDLAGYDRLRVIVNACTRLRFCTADGTMELREKRSLDAIARLVVGPKTVAKRLDDVVGRDTDVRRSALEHLQHGLHHADHGCEGRVFTLREAPRPVKMSEQLVRAVDQMDDHAERRSLNAHPESRTEIVVMSRYHGSRVDGSTIIRHCRLT